MAVDARARAEAAKRDVSAAGHDAKRDLASAADNAQQSALAKKAELERQAKSTGRQ